MIYLIDEYVKQCTNMIVAMQCSTQGVKKYDYVSCAILSLHVSENKFRYVILA